MFTRTTCALMAGLVIVTATAVQAAQPRKIVAMLDGTKNFGTTKRAISFYDVTDVGSVDSSNPSNIFDAQPLFSVWTGFEINTFSDSANYDDFDSFAVNPFNGTIYAVAFDSGAAGSVDAQGDTGGDLDLYRIDYQELLNDFTTNNRAKGTMYGPSLAANGEVDPDHPDHAGTTIHIDDAILKLGEVGRTQGSSFFDRDVEFIDPATLVMMDNEQDSFTDSHTVDHEIRILERISKTPGLANANTTNPDSIEGGYNRQTLESWESDTAAQMVMDFDGNGSPVGQSEPEDMALVKKDGVVGVWIAETDGGGDDMSFFELSGIDNPASDAVATKSTIENTGTSRSLDEDPEKDPTTNDGDHDSIKVDASGNLLIVESGFFDSVPGGEAGNSGPAGEPTVLRLNVDQYTSGNVDLTDFDTWDDLNAGDGLGPVGSDNGDEPNTAPTEIEGPNGSLTNAFDAGTTSGLSLDDDSNVTDGRFTTYDPGTNQLYVFDIDSGSTPGVIADAYVIDLDTGEIVYEELNATNHFLMEHGIRFFTRGDATGDGLVDGDDIDSVYGTISSGTELDREQFDLTGDANASQADVDELVRDVLGTEYGDADLDGDVDADDFNLLAFNFDNPGGWVNGDFDGDGTVSADDFNLLAFNFGFDANVSPNDILIVQEFAQAIPEPTSLALLGLGGLALMRRRR